MKNDGDLQGGTKPPLPKGRGTSRALVEGFVRGERVIRFP